MYSSSDYEQDMIVAYGDMPQRTVFYDGLTPSEREAKRTAARNRAEEYLKALKVLRTP